jgi:hypothetical protein
MISREFILLKSLHLLLTFIALAWTSKALAFSTGDDLTFGLQSPAVITDQSRQSPYYNDFLREIYVIPGTDVDTLGKKNGKQIRAFFGNTKFYFPPITPAAIAKYAGGTNNPANDLVVMECRPTDTTTVDAMLVTWPILAQFLVDDLPSVSDCTKAMTTADKAWCIANAFKDDSVDVAGQTPMPLVITLYNAIKLGKDLFAINNGDGANLLYDLYGIGYGHSGLGFAVNGSASGTFNAAQTLEDSVVPEYLLKNVTLEQANCHCVQVPSYDNRDNQPLSPSFVWNRGTLDNGYCRTVKRILPF